MIHEFYSTGEAYDASQCQIEGAAIMHIPREKVIGIAATWPIAVTVEFGNLHSVEPNISRLQLTCLLRDMNIPTEMVTEAVAKAKELGYPVEPWTDLV